MAARTASIFAVTFLVLAAAVGVAVSQQNLPADRQAAWTAVDQAVQQGLPQTAIERLGPIVEKALAAEDFDDAARAIATRVLMEANVQGGRAEEKVSRILAAIPEAPEPLRPPLHAVAANWYWEYYSQNSWRFSGRTTVDPSAPPPRDDDVSTWTLPRILQAIDSQFDAALAAAEELKRQPVADWQRVLENVDAAQYRPTLYDVLAHEAIHFYSANDWTTARGVDAFSLEADSPVFADRDDFLAWKPEGPDDSLLIRAIELYQDLLRFHAGDADPAALLHCDLERLAFGAQQAVGQEKDARYEAALRRWERQNAGHPLSVEALQRLAQLRYAAEDLVEARSLAAQGAARFPEFPSAVASRNLVKQIEARELSVTTERVWADPQTTIDVRYRNVTRLHLRLLRVDDVLLERPLQQLIYPDEEQLRRLLARRPVRSWSVDLPATEDYKQRVERLAAPEGLASGVYALIASAREDFGKEDNQVSYCPVNVTSLAVVHRQSLWGAEWKGIVADAKAGTPIAGATVRLYSVVYDRPPQPAGTTRTDAAGLFGFKLPGNQESVLRITHGDQEYWQLDSWNAYRRGSESEPTEQTQLFTDRAIYRPGQAIRYKGICLASDTRQGRYEVLPGRNVTLILRDANGEEVERAGHRTNDLGSFSGSFTAPAGRLTGVMTLTVEGTPAGQAAVRVEEYKRPKFEVELAPPAEPAALGAEVSVVGTATAYTGVPISAANVRWRVVREVNFPIWWGWGFRSWPPYNSEPKEISNGTATTDEDGKFTVSFDAAADEAVDAAAEPKFRFTVYADVTDTTGETRSDQRTVVVGYASLSAELNAEDWQVAGEPVELKVRTTSLDGEGRAAEGEIKVHRLREPERVVRDELGGGYRPYGPSGAAREGEPSSDPDKWPLGEVIATVPFETDASGNAAVQVELPAGAYRATLSTRDAGGREVKALRPLQVLNLEAAQFKTKIPFLVKLQRQSVPAGEELVAVWGSGYDAARAYVEVQHEGRVLQAFWTPAGRTQVVIRQKITEAMRGGVQLRVTMVRENRLNSYNQIVDVPWTNKELKVRWERFVSKLRPGQQETWSLVVSGPDAQAAAAEIAATLYDASLDAFAGHSWIDRFNVFRREQQHLHVHFDNRDVVLQPSWQTWVISYEGGQLVYPQLIPELRQNYGYGGGYGRMRGAMAGTGFAEGTRMEGEAYFFRDGSAPMAAAAPQTSSEFAMAGDFAGAPLAKASLADLSAAGAPGRPANTPAPGPDVDLDAVSARQNLQETAFFFPQLVAGKDGTARLEFTMPEALTRWRFIAFAHNAQLRGGSLSDTAVTSKELMVQPNPPRFLREGDEVEFTAKLSNRSDKRQAGKIRLKLASADTEDALDEALGNAQPEQEFALEAGESKSFSWRIRVPDAAPFLTYTVVAASEGFSDGEQGYLPVLSRRILVTESISLPIRDAGEKQFELAKLINSAGDEDLRHQSLTVQVVSNPAWYAVMALPYLMEFPHECSEQVFNRLYANSLARHVANSDPAIERIFERWRGTDALESPLTKNEELKSLTLEETPWVREGAEESKARRNVGVLFDQNRLDDELKRATFQLTQMQLADGRWPWFPGGGPNDFITLYVTTGFGRLRALGVEVDVAPAVRSLAALDAWVDKTYREIKVKEQNHLTSTIALYLYGRSFFMDDAAVAGEHREAFDYFLGQAAEHWLSLPRLSQGHAAVALHRLGKRGPARGIVDSLRERAVVDEELGMFWRDDELSWWWYRAPIETQAMMIEAFDVVADDARAVNDCQVWLIKQKQTQDWRTTKATADAVYAILRRGVDRLASRSLVAATLGERKIEPQSVEAGTGFYQERIAGGEVEPQMGRITLLKKDPGVAWGSLHWQYFQDVGKITPHEGTPLSLTKQLFVKRNTDAGPQLTPVEGPVEVGDELVSRLVLRTDRDMEFVHLKDYRGSGTEPVNVLSGYRYQDGLAYYESTRDAASHFFIDYLPKGTYVFEYSVRVQLRGSYQTGIAEIQCMYAPEFNSHSGSVAIEAR